MLKDFVWLGFTLCLYTADSSTVSPCPSPLQWFSVSGQLYGVTSVTHTSLDNAKWCCANTGWHVRLAVLGSPTEVLELSNYLNRTYVGGQQWEFWVGAERQEGYWQYMYWSWIPGQFAWSDGSSVNARLWKAGEPSNAENCARLMYDGKLYGIDCPKWGSFFVMCQGYKPSGSWCSLTFTWFSVNGNLFGASSGTTSFGSAQSCCSHFGADFRLAVLDDVSLAFDVMGYLQIHHGSMEFWVDAVRPYDDAGYLWSNGKPVDESLWYRTADLREPQSTEHLARISFQHSYGLYGWEYGWTNFGVLCQHYDAQADVTTSSADTTESSNTDTTSTQSETVTTVSWLQTSTTTSSQTTAGIIQSTTTQVTREISPGERSPTFVTAASQLTGLSSGATALPTVNSYVPTADLHTTKNGHSLTTVLSDGAVSMTTAPQTAEQSQRVTTIVPERSSVVATGGQTTEQHDEKSGGDGNAVVMTTGEQIKDGYDKTTVAEKSSVALKNSTPGTTKNGQSTFQAESSVSMTTDTNGQNTFQGESSVAITTISDTADKGQTNLSEENTVAMTTDTNGQSTFREGSYVAMTTIPKTTEEVQTLQEASSVVMTTDETRHNTLHEEKSVAVTTVSGTTEKEQITLGEEATVAMTSDKNRQSTYHERSSVAMTTVPDTTEEVQTTPREESSVALTTDKNGQGDFQDKNSVAMSTISETTEKGHTTPREETSVAMTTTKNGETTDRARGSVVMTTARQTTTKNVDTSLELQTLSSAMTPGETTEGTNDSTEKSNEGTFKQETTITSERVTSVSQSPYASSTTDAAKNKVTLGYRRNRNLCPVRCQTAPPSNANCNAEDESEVQRKIRKLQAELALNVKELSKTTRKLKSARDDRLSARVLGCTGVSLLAGSFLLILCLDLNRIISTSWSVLAPVPRSPKREGT